MKSFDLYLTSEAFLRWGNPKIDFSYQELTNLATSLNKILAEALIENYKLNEKDIESKISYSKEKDLWILDCNLPMLNAIRKKTKTIISELSGELFLKHYSGWDVGALFKLNPVDKITLKALLISRFFRNVKRTGFTSEEGKEQWKLICQETDSLPENLDYTDVINFLIKCKAVKIYEPNVSGIVVDLDAIFMKNRLRTNSWKFSRLLQLENEFKNFKTAKTYYYGTEKIMQKIDFGEKFQNWGKKAGLTIYEDEEGTDRPSIKFASANDLYYIGFSKEDDNSDIFKDMISEGRVINFTFLKKLKIPSIKSVYNWYPVNIIEYIYENEFRIQEINGSDEI